MIDDEIYYLISKYGFAALVAALARYANSPRSREYSVKAFTFSFRQLNEIFEYLKKEAKNPVENND